MIKAIVFDLDGTLIQTEVLKAKSYAIAISNITKGTVTVQHVLDRFSNYVGLSRFEVVSGLVQEFKTILNLCLIGEDTESLQQKVLSERLSIYKDMIDDKELLSAHFCPYNLGLLHSLRKDNYLTALATMSNSAEVNKVLEVMGIRGKLNLVITRDMVSLGKPDPEIYMKAQDILKVKAEECVVIEDSVNGIKAGLNAGMHVFAVTNDITRASVHSSGLLTNEFIVDELTELKPRVYRFLAETGI